MRPKEYSESLEENRASYYRSQVKSALRGAVNSGKCSEVIQDEH